MKLKESENVWEQVSELRILVSQLKKEKQEIQEQLQLLTSALSSQKEYDC